MISEFEKGNSNVRALITELTISDYMKSIVDHAKKISEWFIQLKQRPFGTLHLQTHPGTFQPDSASSDRLSGIMLSSVLGRFNGRCLDLGGAGLPETGIS